MVAREYLGRGSELCPCDSSYSGKDMALVNVTWKGVVFTNLYVIKTKPGAERRAPVSGVSQAFDA